MKFNRRTQVIIAVASACIALGVPIAAFADNAPATPDFSSLVSSASTEATAVPGLVGGIAPILLGIVLVIAALMLVMRLFRRTVGGR
jgi:hypothetical protein